MNSLDPPPTIRQDGQEVPGPPALEREGVFLLAEYANALTGEVQSRAAVESARWLLKCRESVPWISMGADGPLLNGKNEQTREAQFVQWCVADHDHALLRDQLKNAEREHRLAVARVESLAEHLKLVRARLKRSVHPAGLPTDDGLRDRVLARAAERQERISAAYHEEPWDANEIRSAYP